MKTHKEKLTHRIKIIEGHIKAIKNMIENDEYCVDIVLQSLAVQKSLKGMDMQIIEDHLKSCVADQIKNGEEQKAIKELLDIYNLKQ
ncbi:MAG TPA: metal-sensing transcriptional repressor [Candidatus Dojkabacteria bacterium]|nr:metal-sensing transcriptional repressor [Candidatus Dojkabacteria bacterium]